MNISTSYEYNQYSSQTTLTEGVQKSSKRTDKEDSDSVQNMPFDFAQITTSNKPINPLDALVESGTITTEQENAIKKAFEATRMAHKTQAGSANAPSSFKNPLDSLVESGVITKEQGTAVKDAFDSMKKAHKMQSNIHIQKNASSDPLTTILDSLESDGKITSEQEDAILKALQAAFQSSKTSDNTKVDPLDSLVESGVITKDQATSVKNAFDADKRAHGMPPPPPGLQMDGKSDPLKITLDNLVTTGKISSEQEDEILKAVQTALKSIKSQDDTFSNPLDSLVSSGEITKKQKTTVESSFVAAMNAYISQSYSYEDTEPNSFDAGM